MSASIEYGLSVNAGRAAVQVSPQLNQFCISWSKLSLTRQFLVGAVIAAAFSTWLLGEWVADRIKQEIVRYSAASAAPFVTGIVGPLVQNLATGREIAPQAREALDTWHKSPAFGSNIVTTRIWGTDGTVLYSNKPDRADNSRSSNPPLLRPALKGAITSEIIQPEAAGFEPAGKVAMIALFTPIREAGSQRVIAVAEIHQLAAHLKSDLSAVRLQSWIVVGAVIAVVIGLLVPIVRRGSRRIAHQQSAVDHQLGENVRLQEINKRLRLKLKEFHRTLAARHERFLRQVGADLHDGPAQHVAFALLRIDALRPVLAAARIKSSELEKLRSVLQQSHREIRNAVRGLFFPLELEDATTAETVRLAVRRHERRTATKVRCSIGKMPEHVSRRLRLCIYRFIQEGLTNCFRHAAGKDQQVRIHCDGTRINMEIADKGPGCSVETIRAGQGLGLISLRNRVESLGGIFVIESNPESGTRLRSTLFIAKAGVRFGYSDSRCYY